MGTSFLHYKRYDSIIPTVEAARTRSESIVHFGKRVPANKIETVRVHPATMDGLLDADNTERRLSVRDSCNKRNFNNPKSSSPDSNFK